MSLQRFVIMKKIIIFPIKMNADLLISWKIQIYFHYNSQSNYREVFECFVFYSSLISLDAERLRCYHDNYVILYLVGRASMSSPTVL